jgi:hypothetical protein
MLARSLPTRAHVFRLPHAPLVAFVGIPHPPLHKSPHDNAIPTTTYNNPEVNFAIHTLIFMIKQQFKSRFPNFPLTLDQLQIQIFFEF